MVIKTNLTKTSVNSYLGYSIYMYSKLTSITFKKPKRTIDSMLKQIRREYVPHNNSIIHLKEKLASSLLTLFHHFLLGGATILVVLLNYTFISST